MCNFIGPAALVLSAIGGMRSNNANAAIGRTNAALAQYEAKQTAEIGRFNEAQARSRMERLISAQRSQLLARGQSLASTSAQEFGAAAAEQAAMEAETQRFNTSQAVTAKSNEAAIYDYQAGTGLAAANFGTMTRTLGQALDLWPQLMGT